MDAKQPKDGYFQANGLRIHYLEWGIPTAAPMVLVHHVANQAHAWDAFAERMAGDYRILALDMRGHGDSQWAGAGKYTTEHYASDIAGLVDHFGLEHVILLGGSLGGRAALIYAAEHPGKIAALIMEDVGPVRPQAVAEGFAAFIQAGDSELGTVEEWAERLRRGNERAPREVFLHNARHATKRLPSGKLGLKRDPAIQADFTALELWHYVEKIKGPFLMILGSESPIVDAEQQARIRQTAPQVEIDIIQDAGHIVVEDQIEAFEASVRNFLRRRRL